MSTIVVGVDHSAGAKEALRFALEEAKLRQATLRAVHAWHFRYEGWTGMEAGLRPIVVDELHELRDAATAARGGTRESGLKPSFDTGPDGCPHASFSKLAPCPTDT